MTFQDFRTRCKGYLVTECTQLHKLWSTWAVVGSGLLNESVHYWPQFPDDLKQYLPHAAVKLFARISFPAIIISRVLIQKSLTKDKDAS